MQIQPTKPSVCSQAGQQEVNCLSNKMRERERMIRKRPTRTLHLANYSSVRGSLIELKFKFLYILFKNVETGYIKH